MTNQRISFQLHLPPRKFLRTPVPVVSAKSTVFAPVTTSFGPGVIDAPGPLDEHFPCEAVDCVWRDRSGLDATE